VTYDKDLRRLRYGFLVLALANLGSAYLDIAPHKWLSFWASIVWACCCGIQIPAIKVYQRSRDEVRLLQAVINGLREQEESNDR
jgi:hypothetical protein